MYTGFSFLFLFFFTLVTKQLTIVSISLHWRGELVKLFFNFDVSPIVIEIFASVVKKFSLVGNVASYLCFQQTPATQDKAGAANGWMVWNKQDRILFSNATLFIKTDFLAGRLCWKWFSFLFIISINNDSKETCVAETMLIKARFGDVWKLKLDLKEFWKVRN